MIYDANLLQDLLSLDPLWYSKDEKNYLEIPEGVLGKNEHQDSKIGSDGYGVHRSVDGYRGDDGCGVHRAVDGYRAEDGCGVHRVVDGQPRKRAKIAGDQLSTNSSDSDNSSGNSYGKKSQDWDSDDSICVPRIEVDELSRPKLETKRLCARKRTDDEVMKDNARLDYLKKKKNKSELEKKELRTLRNRYSAQKSRNKKKMLREKTEGQIQALQNENQMLRAQLQHMMKERDYYKNLYQSAVPEEEKTNPRKRKVGQVGVFAFFGFILVLICAILLFSKPTLSDLSRKETKARRMVSISADMNAIKKILKTHSKAEKQFSNIPSGEFYAHEPRISSVDLSSENSHLYSHENKNSETFVIEEALNNRSSQQSSY